MWSHLCATLLGERHGIITCDVIDGPFEIRHWKPYQFNELLQNETNVMESPPKRLATEENVRIKKSYKDTVRARYVMLYSLKCSDSATSCYIKFSKACATR